MKGFIFQRFVSSTLNLFAKSTIKNSHSFLILFSFEIIELSISRKRHLLTGIDDKLNTLATFDINIVLSVL